jgi:DNA-binding cell septation regulator SpoVG
VLDLDFRFVDTDVKIEHGSSVGTILLIQLISMVDIYVNQTISVCHVADGVYVSIPPSAHANICMSERHDAIRQDIPGPVLTV